jgi:hypothetical protein
MAFVFFPQPFSLAFFIEYIKIQTTTQNIITSANKWNYANFFKSLTQHNGIYIMQHASPIV